MKMNDVQIGHTYADARFGKQKRTVVAIGREFSLAISLNNLAAGKPIVQCSEANGVMTFLAFCFASMGLISIRRWDLMRLQNGPDAMCLLTPEFKRLRDSSRRSRGTMS